MSARRLHESMALTKHRQLISLFRFAKQKEIHQEFPLPSDVNRITLFVTPTKVTSHQIHKMLIYAVELELPHLL